MLIQIDGTFIFVVISFLIFLVNIKQILYKPFTKAIDEREKFYEKNSKTENNSKQKAKDLILERDKKIKSSRMQAGEIIKKTSLEAIKQSENLVKQTKKELQKELEANKAELQEMSINSKKELKNEMNGFVKLIVSKILNEDVDVDIEESKIEEYLKI